MLVLKQSTWNQHFCLELYPSFSVLLNILSRNLSVLNSAQAQSIRFMQNPNPRVCSVEAPSLFRELAQDIMHSTLRVLDSEASSGMYSKRLLTDNPDLAGSLIRVLEMLNRKQSASLTDLRVGCLVLRLFLQNFGAKNSESIESFLMRLDEDFGNSPPSDELISVSFLLGNFKVSLFSQFLQYKIKRTRAETSSLENFVSGGRREASKYSEVDLLDSANEDAGVPAEFLQSPGGSPRAAQSPMVPLSIFSRKRSAPARPRRMDSPFCPHSTDIGQMLEAFVKISDSLEQEIFDTLRKCSETWVGLLSQLLLNGNNLESLTRHVSLLNFVQAFDLHSKYKGFRDLLQKRTRIFEAKNAKLEARIRGFDVKDLRLAQFIRYSKQVKTEADRVSARVEDLQFASDYEKRVLACVRQLAISNFNLFRDAVVLVLRSHFSILLKFYQKIDLQNSGKFWKGRSQERVSKTRNPQRQVFHSFCRKKRRRFKFKRFRSLSRLDKKSHSKPQYSSEEPAQLVSSPSSRRPQPESQRMHQILKDSPGLVEESSIFLKNKGIIDYLDRYIKLLGASRLSQSQRLLRFFVSLKNLCGLKFLFILVRSKGKIIYFGDPPEGAPSSESILPNSNKKKRKTKAVKARKTDFSICNMFNLWKFKEERSELQKSLNEAKQTIVKKQKKVGPLGPEHKDPRHPVRSAENTFAKCSSNESQVGLARRGSPFSNEAASLNNFFFSEDEERIQKLIPKVHFNTNADVSRSLTPVVSR